MKYAVRVSVRLNQSTIENTPLAHRSVEQNRNHRRLPHRKAQPHHAHTTERDEASTLTETHAKRLKRPTIKDWRFILGVLLVLVSITGVQLYVQANNSKTEYYTAKSEIRLGEKITEDKLARIEANIDSAKDKYSPAPMPRR